VAQPGRWQAAPKGCVVREKGLIPEKETPVEEQENEMTLATLEGVKA